MEGDMKNYEWREHERNYGIDADVAGNLLTKLTERDGELTADSVVKEAKKKSSPLHPWFEWDDTEAAHKFRKNQARKLIQSINVRIIGDTDAEPIRAFVHLGTTNDKSGYATLAHVLSEPELRIQLVAKALAELNAVKGRYSHLTELAEVFAAMDEVAA